MKRSTRFLAGIFALLDGGSSYGKPMIKQGGGFRVATSRLHHKASGKRGSFQVRSLIWLRRRNWRASR